MILSVKWRFHFVLVLLLPGRYFAELLCSQSIRKTYMWYDMGFQCCACHIILYTFLLGGVISAIPFYVLSAYFLRNKESAFTLSHCIFFVLNIQVVYISWCDATLQVCDLGNILPYLFPASSVEVISFPFHSPEGSLTKKLLFIFFALLLLLTGHFM
jgi:hypothetical protein